MEQLKSSELILNSDGSVYHLHLKPENIADTIILVGDPGRVETVSNFFDTIEFKQHNREFFTHTGTYKGKRITVLSTGIGTDNIDIVVNELDALVNIDLEKRIIKEEHTTLNLIRLGTSGGLQAYLGVDSFVASEFSIGFDGLLNFYKDRNTVVNLEAEMLFVEHTGWNELLAKPYILKSSETLLNKLAFDMHKGMSISAPGFYAPQGRKLRLAPVDETLNDRLALFSYQNVPITNYEMECSAIYGLSALLGHNALTICVIIANRAAKMFSKDYHPAVQKLIQQTLDRIVS